MRLKWTLKALLQVENDAHVLHVKADPQAQRN